MILACCREPYSDETLYSYICSLFRRIGFKTVAQINAFLGFGSIYADYAIGLPFMKERIGNVTFPEVDRMMRMLPGHGVTYAECALQPEKQCFLKPATEGKVYVCLECLRADLDRYGEAYLHLSHQQDRKHCSVHGVGLRYASVAMLNKGLKPFEQYEYADCVQDGFSVMAGSQDSYVWSVCNTCGRRYLEHAESRKRGIGCPYCNALTSSDVIANRMLDALYDGEYKLVGALDSLRSAVVEHTLCGTTSIKLHQLLTGKQVECKECKSLIPTYLQRRFDPERREWVFLDTDEKDRNRRRIRVLHKVCGKESFLFMPQYTSKEGGYCPVCDNPQKRVEISELDSEYEICGEYKNNREAVKIRHKTCGVVFDVSKTSFIAGARCPLCVPRYSFADVERAVKECCPGWTVVQEMKRGMVSLIMPNGFVLSGYPYGMVVADLKSEKSTIFQNKVKRWSDPVSLRKTIYDRIAEGTRSKGYWTFADGLGEVTDPSMPGGVSRERRNIVQDLAKLGFIERCGKGQYRVVK